MITLLTAITTAVILGFPAGLSELALWVTFTTLVMGAFAAFAKSKPGKALIENNITHPLSRWMETRVVDATTPHRETTAKFQQYVEYHLGPNGTTTPVHQRLQLLERDSVIGETRQRRFMDNIDVLVAESGPDGQTNFVNLALCNKLECDPEDWYGEGWKNFIAEEQLPSEVERWESVMDRQAANPFHPLTLVSKKTKTRIPVKARSFPIKDSRSYTPLHREAYVMVGLLEAT